MDKIYLASVWFVQSRVVPELLPPKSNTPSPLPQATGRRWMAQASAAAGYKYHARVHQNQPGWSFVLPSPSHSPDGDQKVDEVFSGDLRLVHRCRK